MSLFSSWLAIHILSRARVFIWLFLCCKKGFRFSWNYLGLVTLCSASVRYRGLSVIFVKFLIFTLVGIFECASKITAASYLTFCFFGRCYGLPVTGFSPQKADVGQPSSPPFFLLSTPFHPGEEIILIT